MKIFPLTTVLLLMSLAIIAAAQGSKLGESCDLASQGANETASFLAFDRELRSALSTQDAGLMALLVTFPLRVNDQRGSFYLKDPGSLQGWFQEVFPTKLRRIVLDQNPKTVFCNYAGVMYGNGVIWVSKTNKGYGLATVNAPTSGESKGTGYRVEFACQTEKDRIIIDQPEDDTLRYRMWHKPHSLLDKPDAETKNGKKEVHGTGPCVYSSWSFTQGGSRVVVAGMGCSSGDQPENAVGTIGATDEQRNPVWCY